MRLGTQVVLNNAANAMLDFPEGERGTLNQHVALAFLDYFKEEERGESYLADQVYIELQALGFTL